MLLNNPFKDPVKFAIKVLDFKGHHLLPCNPHVPLIYPQHIALNTEMFPEKPINRSQLTRYLEPIALKEWAGGAPIGRIIEETDNELFRLAIKQYRHKLVSLIYNPPFVKRFNWNGNKEQALEAAKNAQKEFCDKWNVWRNMYRVNYCEFTDMFFLQVRVNHFFSECVFECDFADIDTIFAHTWYLGHIVYKDKFKDTRYKYFIYRKENTQNRLITQEITHGHENLLYLDNNVLNNRRSNLGTEVPIMRVIT